MSNILIKAVILYVFFNINCLLNLLIAKKGKTLKTVRTFLRIFITILKILTKLFILLIFSYFFLFLGWSFFPFSFEIVTNILLVCKSSDCFNKIYHV